MGEFFKNIMKITDADLNNFKTTETVKTNTPLGKILLRPNYKAHNMKDNVPKLINTIKAILNRIKELPNYEDIMFFILNSNEIKLRVDKTNNIFNFSVLEDIQEKSDSVSIFQDKYYGILKK